jgi:hypothetical protein
LDHVPELRCEYWCAIACILHSPSLKHADFQATGHGVPTFAHLGSVHLTT